MTPTLTLAQDLIKRRSITPDDKGCQQVLINRLKKIDFAVEQLQFANVDNFWASRGNKNPVFVFGGHTDVVPVGNAGQWQTDAFTPTIKNGLLYGRGAADMKGSLAAMLVATERFVADFPNHQGTIAFLITADEEGPAINGTLKVVQHLQKTGQTIDYCLLGEPSSAKQLGDIIKNGRRGSLNGTLRIIGKQGHIAYPHLAANPVHLAMPALDELCGVIWDKGNADFPATRLQISNINAGTGVSNVIPAELSVQFNFRYSTAITHQQLQKRLTEILLSHNLNFKIDWQHSGEPFLTNKGDLVNACADAIKSVKNIECQLSTAGGTSDGRFIAPIMNAEVIELGPLNATIHQVNECVSLQDLEDLTSIYYQILKNIL